MNEPEQAQAAPPGAAEGTLLEVAIALPLYPTYTYRDPRREQVVPVGAQVVVPFGPRTVTGFVVAHLPAGSQIEARLYDVRDIEGVADGADPTALPPFDPDMIAFCRWVAEYYVAPVGEVLRGALPQGERSVAVRSARLTVEGEAYLASPGSQVALKGLEGEVGLSALTGFLGHLRRGPVPLRRLRRLDSAGTARLPRWVSAGLVEVGDALSARRKEPVMVIAHLGERSGEPSPRAVARREVWAAVRAAGDAGLAWPTLSAPARTHLRALAKEGFVRLTEVPRPRSTIADVNKNAASEVPGLVEQGSVGAAGLASSAALPATAAQKEAIDALTGSLGQGFSPFLLHGVTGSGKTEVYLQVIAAARAQGRGALVLVPEIALTPQLAGRFRARFGDDVAVLHSALAPKERLAAWRRLRRGEVGIAVGARSAVFAPVARLGVIVVDEEHDPSFKQEEGVRYHGRDIALVRGQRQGTVVVLGSATPSLESYRNVKRGRLRLLRLPERATPRPLPVVELVDLRRTPPGPDGVLSGPLAEALSANLAAGRQTILFLNRRGFSPLVLCRACGHVVRCTDCAVSLTYHQGKQRLLCHYCGRLETVPVRCPACRATRLERLGIGTERVEDVVRGRYRTARVARLDRDTAGEGGAGEAGGRGLERILAGMHEGSLDILVGTQMVTKGHDFPLVTLVGVLQPDQALGMPDFRAAERTFQLLEQVAGRAGRGAHAGRVLVQTYEPDHPAICAAVVHDYEGFAEGELAVREELGYPPAVRMLALRFDGPDAAAVEAFATRVAEACRAVLAPGDAVRMRGPAEAPIPRLRGRSRYQLWLSCRERGPLAAAARAALAVRPQGDVRLAVDVDPQSVL